MDKKTRVYVGCALTHVGQDYRDLIERLKALLGQDPSLEILDFMPVDNSPATEMYHWDVGHCIGTCDLFLAVCDHAATALGYEMATAVEKRGIPVLAVAHQNSLVSTMILGVPHPLFNFERYEDLLRDVPKILKQKIDKHFAVAVV